MATVELPSADCWVWLQHAAFHRPPSARQTTYQHSTQTQHYHHCFYNSIII